MRKYPRIVSALAVCLMLTTACNNDEDGRPPGAGQVSPQAQSTFESLFPGAHDVEWEVRGTYAVADFSYSDADGGGWVPGSAWFNQSDGAWLMSEYDVRFDRLPEAVKAAFQASEYATWHVDDVDLIRREGVTLLYVIEVENAGQEMDLYYTEDGVLVKAVADGGGQSDYDGLIPSTPGGSVMDFIRSHYPDARIVEVDTDDGLTEVELVDAGRVLREVVFDRSGAWLYTQTEVRRADLPAAVVAAWDSSEYAETNGYRLDDIDFFETANDGSYYRLELDSRFGDVKLRVTPDGQLSLYLSAGSGAIVGGEVEPSSASNILALSLSRKTTTTVTSRSRYAMKAARRKCFSTAGTTGCSRVGMCPTATCPKPSSRLSVRATTPVGKSMTFTMPRRRRASGTSSRSKTTAPTASALSASLRRAAS